MEKTQHVMTPTIETVHVLPRTLVMKVMPIPGGEAVGVYGAKDSREGTEADVWVASFFDQDEAKAWILGNRNFGQAIRGGIVSASRVNSGELPEDTGGGDGGSVREVPGNGEGGTGSTGELP